MGPPDLCELQLVVLTLDMEVQGGAHWPGRTLWRRSHLGLRPEPALHKELIEVLHHDLYGVALLLLADAVDDQSRVAHSESPSPARGSERGRLAPRSPRRAVAAGE
jgi:hypothetical protein